MNKRVLVVVIIVGALLVGSIAAAALMFLPVSAPDSAPRPTPTASASSDLDEEVVEPGTYVDYTPRALADSAGRSFLFFYAPWCGECRKIDAGILAQGVPDGVTIYKVDFDSEQELEQQYGVTMRTTFVEIDEGGTEVQRFVAFDTPTFDAVIAAMF